MMASYVGPNDDVLISVRPGEGDVCLSKVPSTLTVQADNKDSLPARFGRYWTRKKLSDMVIMCRGQIFEVHRVILSGFSTLFETAISNQLENDTLILDYDPVSMNICLEYLYMGRTEVDRDHAKAVASLANILDIPHLYNTCRAAELKDATAGADNCLDMWSFGETVGDGELLRRGKNAALANVDDLMEQESFMNLSYSHLKELVSHEDLVVSSAFDRLGITMLWVGHDSSTRSQHLTSLLTVLPLNKMSRVSLRQMLHNPVIKEHTEAGRLLCQSMETCKAETQGNISMMSSMVTCLVSMGRLKPNAYPDNDSAVIVTPLSFTSKLYKLTDLPSSLPDHYCSSVACYAVGSSLYVTGLGEKYVETWHFNMDTVYWQQFGAMQHGRLCHCMVECGGTVYSIGGREPGDSLKLVPLVEALDVKTNTWRDAGSLSGSVCGNTACCVVDGEVLIHGILDGADNRLVQVYSPHTEQSRCHGSFKCGKLRSVCGVVVVAGKTIMADNNGLYVCSASPHKKFNVAQRPLYELPCGGISVIYLSEDGQFIMAIGGWSRDGSSNHVYRAPVNDVISNTGKGWQPVDMEWSPQGSQLVPGAHCTASIGLNRLSRTSAS